MSAAHQKVVLACVLFFVCVVGCDPKLEGPSPQIVGELEPHLVCNQFEPMTTVAVSGSGFSPLPVDTAMETAQLELPVLTLQRSSDLQGTTVTSEPVVVPDESPETSQVHWYSQQRMNFDVTPELGLDEGIYGLTVANPNGNSTTLETVLAVVPPPELTTITPDAICVDQSDVSLTITGSGFLDIAGEQPTITVRDSNGAEWSYEPTEMTDCFTLPIPASDTQSCTTITFVIPQGDIPPGSYEVVVTNPPPANCESSVALNLEVVPPPVLESVAPGIICTSGGTIGLQGRGFRPGATVEVNGIAAETVEVAADGESATATFPSGISQGSHDVTITNSEGCSSTLLDAAEVIQGPVIFWVDPPVVYNGIATQITIFGSGLSDEVLTVELVPSDEGDPIPLDYVLDTTRGRIQAVVPAGTPADSYDVRVLDSVCPVTLEGGLVVTETLTIDIDAIDPSFGWTEQSQPVSIFGSGFVTTPRAYLNPEDPTPETLATTLSTVAYIDTTRLTAVVQGGLPVGTYDLIVVNPTGEVGLLEGGFSITADAPPYVDSATPGEVDSGEIRDIDVAGGNFSEPTVSWVCRDEDGDTTTPNGTVGSWDESSASITLDATSLTAGTVCVLRVTNADGAYGEYSAVAITNPSSNLRDFSEGTNMTTGRRGLALIAGRATRAARFIYALGGDDGTEAGAMDSSESASVDIFGDMDEWFEQPNGLPGPLTLSTAYTIGRFIYLVGGHDGTSVVDDVWRAEILDPLDAPIIADIEVHQGEGEGLGPGIWYYRISAVYPEDHPLNPDGESLASDPLVIHLPESLIDTLRITLFWEDVDGAETYRIYRSPEPNMASGSEMLLAEIPATGPREFEDDGSATPSGASPLPLGAHGTWVSLPPLNTPRASHGLGYAVDPADPGISYLYAIGGVDETGTTLASFELLSIEVASPVDQTVAPTWIDGTEMLSLARQQLGIYSVDHAAALRVPLGTTYIYAISGLDDSDTAVDNAEVAIVTSGGQLGTWEVLDSASNTAGFATAAAGNFLYIMGGGPSATNRVESGEICGLDLSCTGGPDDPPDIQNWNNEGGTSLSPERYLPGCTLESAFIFVVGGIDSDGTVLNSTDQTVW